MKKIMVLLVLFVTIISLSAQESNVKPCDPDGLCIDIDKPGQVCPRELLNAFEGKHYSQILTVIPPATYSLGKNFGTVKLTKIVIVDVQGLPEGVIWSKSDEEFFITDPYNRYCCSFYGIPKEYGTYPLTLKIKPYFMFMGREISPMNITDKSLVINVLHEDTSN